jgi:hypothetical protein
LGLARLESLEIVGGHVTATCRGDGAGIGTGQARVGHSVITSLAITGGNVSAVSVGDGPGIGAGAGVSECPRVTNVTIAGGWVNAASLGGGAGIGCGTGSNRVESVTLANADVQISSKSGYGIGWPSDLSFVGAVNMTIVSGMATAVASSAIQLTNVVMKVVTNVGQVLEMAPTLVGGSDLVFLYDTSGGATELIGRQPGIEFASLKFPDDALWEVTLAGPKANKSVIFNAWKSKKLTMTVPEPGVYTAPVRAGSETGLFVADNGTWQFTIGDQLLYVGDIHMALSPPAPPEPSKPSTSRTTIIVVAVGCLALLVAATIGVVCAVLRRNKPRDRDELSVLSNRLLGDANYFQEA